MLFSKKDKKSIELLPEAERPAGSTKIKFLTGIVAALIIVLLLIVAIAIFLLNTSETRQSRQLSKQLDDKIASWQELADTAQDVSLIKAKVGELQKITNSTEIYLETLVQIRSSVPAGVTLISLEMEKSNYLKLQASAIRPASLYQFVEQLKGEKDFVTQVTVSSLSKGADMYVINLDLGIKSK